MDILISEKKKVKYSLDKMLEHEFEHLEVFFWQFLGEEIS